MSNAEQALPKVQIVCEDRIRNFCLNLGAFAALEQHMRQVTEDPEFSVLEDFDWNASSMENVILTVWAGCFTDSKDDSEPWTPEKAADVVNVMSLPKAQAMIAEGLKRMMTAEQYARLEAEAKARGQKKKAKAEEKAKRKGQRKVR